MIIDEFYDRSSSESQRSLALRCISLSVKELAGWGDSKVKFENTRGLCCLFTFRIIKVLTSSVSTSQNSENQLVDAGIDSLDNMLSDSLVLEPANTATSSKTVGKTRVFSKKSEIDNRRTKPTRNRLAGIVSKLIFFPLMQGYWEGTRTRWRYCLINMSTQTICQHNKTSLLIIVIVAIILHG